MDIIFAIGEPFSKIFVFRYSSKVDSEQLIEAAKSLLNKTVYERPSLREEAPQKTDCLTAVHYLFQKTLKMSIPLTYIGDMPRKLVSCSEWRPLNVQREELECGDLLFVKNNKRAKLISHIAMVIDGNAVFHCNPEDKTAVIDDWDKFFSRYSQNLSFRRAVRYIDPRNTKKRSQEEGLFITS